MAKRKKKDEHGFEAEAEAPERDERQQQVIDGLKEKQSEHLDALHEKVDADEDASSEIAALGEVNRAISAEQTARVFIPPTGNERSNAGAAGTCVVGPEAHLKIMALGGAITDEVHSGHASIEELVPPPPPPGTESAEEEEVA